MAEPDWADDYDPTNPDGPEPRNMTDFKADSPRATYDPLRTNLGPVGFVKGAPQVDPLPYDVPPDLNPNMEIRSNEGPFFSQSNRRENQTEAHRDINDYLQKMLPPLMAKAGSPYRSLDVADALKVQETPAVRLATDHMMGHDYWPLTPMGVTLGGDDLDRYNRTFHMPNFPRDERLANDNTNYGDALTIRSMPEYMRKDAAEQLARDNIESKLEENTVWEGKDAPTQGDIDKVKANPTDGMIQMFEDQFGADAVSKIFPDEEEAVPLPKPRPKSAPKRK